MEKMEVQVLERVNLFAAANYMLINNFNRENC